MAPHLKLTIRSETPSDVEAIEALVEAAFATAEHSSGAEQRIVRALRAANQLTVALVAVADGELVGYVAISPVAITGGAEGWFGLGPIAVSPQFQRRGIGSELLRGALAALRESGASGCVVLGDPGYYGRFGFRAEPKLILPGVPPRYFQAIVFRGDVPDGAVSYHDAFAAA
jgi:predicted N-acetyltransferase YhbS